MISFQLPVALLLLFLLVFLSVKALRFHSKRKIAFLNILVIFLLVLALAGPEITIQEESETQKSLNFIEDTSESSQLIENPELEPDNVEIERYSVDSDSSDFEPHIREIVEENETYLFSSDLQFESDLPQYFVDKNASVNLLEASTEEETAVKINGPSETVIGAENEFEVDASSTLDDKPDAQLYKNDRIIEQGELPFEVTMSFEEEGFNEIWAEIDEEDYYDQNNQYYKSLEVREKPLVASVGEHSNLEEELEEFYDINSYEALPDDLERYELVLMKQPEDSESLREFLVEGGGLIYTGDDYNLDYLPVREAERPEDTDAPVVVFALDISVGTGESGAAEAGKQIAHDIVGGLPDNARAGVVAYNRYAYDIIEPSLLATDRDEVQSKIASLEPEGPTLHNYGLRGAGHMVDRADTDEGNVVMIADGKISVLAERRNVVRESQREAERLNSRLITVGVGDQYPREIEDEDREFLTGLAERTEGGFYIEGHSADDLEIALDAGGGEGEMQPLVVSDSTHFITEGYSPNSSVHSIDGVEPKEVADTVVSTSNGEPVLTVNNYGLGRIAAFSADTANLERLMDQDPSLVGRTFSWAVGPTQEDEWIEGERKEDQFLYVSETPGENLTRESDERYTRELNPESTGFHKEEDITYSVNYRPEIENVGYNEQEFSTFTVNGHVYDEESLDLLYDSLEAETFEERETLDLRPYLLISSLLAYLGFVGLRKNKGLA